MNSSSSSHARAQWAPRSVRRGLLYVATARRAIRRYGLRPDRAFGRIDDRPVFVVASPRSGTTFMAETLGGITGFADLGELGPLKEAIPRIARLPIAQSAPQLRSIIRRAQRTSLLVGMRAIEQTPESAFLIPALAHAFPHAQFVHMVRDGRDVATSLLEKNWLGRGAQAGWTDDVGQPYGAHARFWVEADRTEAFTQASDARRVAWAWRRYESAVLEQSDALGDRMLTVRYESMVDDPETTACNLARFLNAQHAEEEFVTAFRATRDSARGRWRNELPEGALADIMDEAGTLLTQLGYCAEPQHV